MRSIKRYKIVMALWVILVFYGIPFADLRDHQIEKRMINHIATGAQFQEVHKRCFDAEDLTIPNTYVWWYASETGHYLGFEATCWDRGSIRGTSVIPPP